MLYVKTTDKCISCITLKTKFSPEEMVRKQAIDIYEEKLLHKELRLDVDIAEDYPE
jgi:hypothetical protein